MKYVRLSILLITSSLFTADKPRRYSIHDRSPHHRISPPGSHHAHITAQWGTFYQVEETRDNVEELQREVQEVKKDVGEIKTDLKDFMVQTQASFDLIMKTLNKSKD